MCLIARLLLLLLSQEDCTLQRPKEIDDLGSCAYSNQYQALIFSCLFVGIRLAPYHRLAHEPAQAQSPYELMCRSKSISIQAHTLAPFRRVGGRRQELQIRSARAELIRLSFALCVCAFGADLPALRHFDARDTVHLSGFRDILGHLTRPPSCLALIQVHWIYGCLTTSISHQSSKLMLLRHSLP